MVHVRDVALKCTKYMCIIYAIKPVLCKFMHTDNNASEGSATGSKDHVILPDQGELVHNTQTPGKKRY